MTNFVSGLFRFALKLILAAFGLVFVVSLLASALIVLAFSLLKSLITRQENRHPPWSLAASRSFHLKACGQVHHVVKAAMAVQASQEMPAMWWTWKCAR